MSCKGFDWFARGHRGPDRDGLEEKEDRPSQDEYLQVEKAQCTDMAGAFDQSKLGDTCANQRLTQPEAVESSHLLRTQLAYVFLTIKELAHFTSNQKLFEN